MSHLPAAGRPVPVSTYRVQLRPPAADHPGFTFDDAAATVPYLGRLGVTHLYCSPYLQAASGSAHGYDVVDPTHLNAELGGEPAFARLVDACRSAGLGIVVDVVPNHVAISEPESQNAAWWSVLKLGRASPYAAWFDIDWESPTFAGKVMVPVLGAPLEDVLDELVIDGDRIRYYDHEVPLRPGSVVEGDLAATLAGQHYVLAHWKQATAQLNYRRFFDVTTLAGARVEVPSVFDATQGLLVEQVRAGLVDGLRIDHPDGLADPAGYLQRLAEQTGGTWVVVEKILEPGEQLPDAWACAGTTGYDVLNDVLGLFVDPAGEQPLTAHWLQVTGSAASYPEVVEETKRLVLTDVLIAEVNRLTAVAARAVGPTAPPALLRAALVEVLLAFEVYRAYLPPAGPPDDVARQRVDHAVARAQQTAPELREAIALIGRLSLAEADPVDAEAAREFVTRFQQTCGPVMAKGVEDTAFYRYARFTALNEVGGDPGRFGLSQQDFHDACRQRLSQWPLSMTALSTHDTKRSEDVRARLVLLSQCPEAWVEAVREWSHLAERYRSAAGPDPATEQLIWQTLVGAWPLTADRAVAYLQKATREAKSRTSWLEPQSDYESAVESFVRGVMSDGQLTALLEDFVRVLAPAWRATVLAQKLVQLTVPGVADTFQGTECVDLSLVDPDNRRAVDYAARAALMDLADDDSLDGAKLTVTAAALRLRRAHPEWFLAGSTYAPLDAGPQALAFSRSEQVVTVVPVRAMAVEREGWEGATVDLPAGAWRDVFTDRLWTATVALADLLDTVAVALLTREAGP
ncbi:MAG: malto-oligosyltrehalose synthase [Mycobacteriales bacterium]